MNATEYSDRITAAMIRGASKAHTVDVSGYPADVAEAIEVVCELWYLHPPGTKRGKTYWIMQARELMDACGEFGLDAIRQYRKVFERYMEKHQGLPPHTVEGPGSLVKSVRAQAGVMREGVTPAQRQMRQDEASRRRYGE